MNKTFTKVSFRRAVQKRFYSDSPSDSFTSNYDIVIVGGGIAGSTLANALGSSNVFKDKKVALIDPAPLNKISQWNPPMDRFENRTVQITGANQKYLSSIGIWDHLYKERVQPYSHVIVTDQTSQAKLEFDNRSLLISENHSPAYLVENSNLLSACLKSVSKNFSESKNIDIYQDSKVVSISDNRNSPSDNDWPLLHLSNGKSLKARLLVGTDGINSLVRKYANIDTNGWDYNQFGNVANLCFDKYNTTAYQRFLPSGPIAVLPLPNGFANLVWSMDSQISQKLKLVSDKNFIKFVNLAFRLHNHSDFMYLLNLLNPDGSVPDHVNFDQECLWRLNKTSFDQNSSLDLSESLSNSTMYPPQVIEISPNSRQSFPLRLRIADKFYSNRVALVGDAAHTMHPLAGQGLNTGISDVISLSNILKDAVLSGSDIGSTEYVLAKYNSERYWSNAALQGSIDKLWRLFRSQNPIVSNFRRMGMDLIDHFPSFKNQIIKSTML
ncbi:Ubiquinone biosynthesis monooxygenase COQ6, mitochondrial [Smittium mucronatum]|uniref:Ubiquinone biosynthesis monooxygenase COQ6, mitochondrial n=1 Tax=Smittium mucronatum TaxID=133383 RepID=A0A1R0GLS8_9FUNG|nr:Ubiquinone biosynthesis monooxygenase COQ6, mitochondrial [Smittium mucronatum]